MTRYWHREAEEIEPHLVRHPEVLEEAAERAAEVEFCAAEALQEVAEGRELWFSGSGQYCPDGGTHEPSLASLHRGQPACYRCDALLYQLPTDTTPGRPEEV